MNARPIFAHSASIQPTESPEIEPTPEQWNQAIRELRDDKWRLLDAFDSANESELREFDAMLSVLCPRYRWLLERLAEKRAFELAEADC